jgi:hypothetical protein
MKKNRRRYMFPDGTNYPIVESTKVGMTLMVQQRDVEHASRKNPEACAVAQCALRMGALKAYIAGTVAYVVMKFKGELVAIKYRVPYATQQAIKTFDKKGTFPEDGFVLGPLENSRTHKVKAEANAKRTPEQRRWGGKTRGVRADLRTYRHLSGHVRTTADKPRKVAR